MAWTIQLLCKSSRLPTLDHCYLDGYVPPTIQQPEGITACLGERQAEVHYEVQMVWHLNTLPGGISGLKFMNLDECWSCSH